MHGLEDGECRPHGALRVVVVRPWDAERRHHGVAGELLDGAAVALDAVGGTLEVARDPTPDDLRIGRLDQLGRIDQIDEDDGGELTLHGSSLGCGDHLPEASNVRACGGCRP